MKPEQHLDAAKKTFTERNSGYKDTWKKAGRVTYELFEGVTDTKHLDSHGLNKLHIVFHIVGKLCRYVNSGMKHKDSIHDIINYAAMLYSLNDEDKDDTVF